MPVLCTRMLAGALARPCLCAVSLRRSAFGAAPRGEPLAHRTNRSPLNPAGLRPPRSETASNSDAVRRQVRDLPRIGMAEPFGSEFVPPCLTNLVPPCLTNPRPAAYRHGRAIWLGIRYPLFDKSNTRRLTRTKPNGVRSRLLRSLCCRAILFEPHTLKRNRDEEGWNSGWARKNISCRAY
jgi:hypothetical protein